MEENAKYAQIPENESGMKIRAKNEYMAQAINEALNGISKAHGGPFGCVIVKDGKIVGRGHNMVLVNHDSTAHGEVSAIRDAEDNLDTHDLTGCSLYTTGEPCPMCLYACLWANIDKLYYGCTVEDNSMIGFRDEEFSELGDGRESLGEYLNECDREACLELFRIYSGSEHKLY